jgi:hypothetical protein
LNEDVQSPYSVPKLGDYADREPMNEAYCAVCGKAVHHNLSYKMVRVERLSPGRTVSGG